MLDQIEKGATERRDNLQAEKQDEQKVLDAQLGEFWQQTNQTQQIHKLEKEQAAKVWKEQSKHKDQMDKAVNGFTTGSPLWDWGSSIA